MKPFANPFDFESQAFGFHYTANVTPDFTAQVWLRVPLGHVLYGVEGFGILDQDLPDWELVDAFFAERGGVEDRSGWWFRIDFPVETFGEVIEAVERICRTMAGEDVMINETPGATVGSPGWEVL